VHDETDETIIRIAAALRPMPEVDPARKASVLVAVAAERERARERRKRIVRAWRLGGAAAFVAAARKADPERVRDIEEWLRDRGESAR